MKGLKYPGAADVARALAKSAAARIYPDAEPTLTPPIISTHHLAYRVAQICSPLHYVKTQTQQL